MTSRSLTVVDGLILTPLEVVWLYSSEPRGEGKLVEGAILV